jgi:hypothetical protein
VGEIYGTVNLSLSSHLIHYNSNECDNDGITIPETSKNSIVVSLQGLLVAALYHPLLQRNTRMLIPLVSSNSFPASCTMVSFDGPW